MRVSGWLFALSCCVACSGAAGSTDAVGAAGEPSLGGTAPTSGAPSVSGGTALSGSSGVAAGGTSASQAGASVGGAGNGGSSGRAGESGGSNTAGHGGGGAAGALPPFKGVANSPCAARTALNVSWYYNWTQKETEPCAAGVGGDFVPMIWGHPGAEQTGAAIQGAVAGFVSKGYPDVLGFNEPDNSAQSNIPSATAISLLPSFDNTAIKVGTPATQANSAGQAWFKDYMAKVVATASLPADFIALHWYGWDAGSCDASASQLESYIKYAEGFAGSRPIWLTEWSCLNQSAPSAAGVLAFYKGALAVFAKHPRVQRYAWYPWTTNCGLNNADGSLTPLGVAYAAAPARK